MPEDEDVAIWFKTYDSEPARLLLSTNSRRDSIKLAKGRKGRWVVATGQSGEERIVFESKVDYEDERKVFDTEWDFVDEEISSV
jgi:LEA14-like dessication related protein